MKKPVVVAALLLLGGAARAAETETETSSEKESSGFAPATNAELNPATSFGTAGQFVLTMGARTGQHLLYHKQGSAWQLQLQPALDYFVISRLSVGGIIGYRHATGGTGTGANSAGIDTFTIGGRAGFNFTINGLFGVWPLAGLLLDYLNQNHTGTTNTWLTLAVPVLFHPATHFFAALGPSFEVNLSGPAANQIGVDTMLGGWF
jgi:hypothetical protein